jgi:hypothetical protein
MTEEEKEQFYQEALTSIARRRQKDEDREIDPVKEEENNPLQYWHNSRIMNASATQYARRFNVPVSVARRITHDDFYYQTNRPGVGALARQEDRQVVIDTNPIGKDDMINRVHAVVEEALDA